MSPLVKIISYLIFLVLIFIFNNYYSYAFFTLFLFFLSLRISYKRLLKGWFIISIFLTFTFIGNLFFHYGRVISNIGLLFITDEGLNHATIRTWRIFLMIYGAKLVTVSTEPERLVNGIAKIFKPLKTFHINVDEFFSVLCLTIKYLPDIKNKVKEKYNENLDKRDTIGFISRLKYLSAFLIPLFIESIEFPDKIFEKDKLDED